MIMNTFHLNAPSGPAQTAPLGSLTPTYVRIWAESAGARRYEVYTYVFSLHGRPRALGGLCGTCRVLATSPGPEASIPGQFRRLSHDPLIRSNAHLFRAVFCIVGLVSLPNYITARSTAGAAARACLRAAELSYILTRSKFPAPVLGRLIYSPSYWEV